MRSTSEPGASARDRETGPIATIASYRDHPHDHEGLCFITAVFCGKPASALTSRDRLAGPCRTTVTNGPLPRAATRDNVVVMATSASTSSTARGTLVLAAMCDGMACCRCQAR